MEQRHTPSHHPQDTDHEAEQEQATPAHLAAESSRSSQTPDPETAPPAAASAADRAPAPQAAVPDATVSGNAGPQNAAPAPQAAAPDAATEATAPQAATPDAAAPDTAGSQSAAPEAPSPATPPAQASAQPDDAGTRSAEPAPATPQAAPAAQDKDFAAILAEFEQGKAAELARQGDAAAAGGTGGGGTSAAAASAGSGPGAGPGTVKPTPNVGQKVSGKVLSITGDQVFVDLGTKSEGMIEAAQLCNAEGQITVQVGDSLDAIVTAIDPESGVVVLRKKASGRGGHQEVAVELRQASQYGMPVEGQVTGINKGGAEVQAYGMRAFCPLSQLDLRYVENPQQFIGQRLKFKVARIEEGGRNRRPDIVLSRRALLEEEAQAKAAELRARLQVGAVMKGRITSLTSYGAFVDLGGLEGLLHVSEIGYSRLADPREALSLGQEIEVQVIKIEKGKDEKRPERISLSRRALERDPWRDAADRFPEGAVLPGRVMRLESFGAFVEVAPGLEGLVHVSEFGAGRRLNHAREAVQVGQDVRVRVLNVDPVKRRISLSMALADEHHEPVEEAAPREPAAAGQPAGSFGALGDFFKSSSQRRK
jgi:small subunit ribosomal protein S1